MDPPGMHADFIRRYFPPQMQPAQEHWIRGAPGSCQILVDPSKHEANHSIRWHARHARRRGRRGEEPDNGVLIPSGRAG